MIAGCGLGSWKVMEFPPCGRPDIRPAARDAEPLVPDFQEIEDTVDRTVDELHQFRHLGSPVKRLLRLELAPRLDDFRRHQRLQETAQTLVDRQVGLGRETGPPHESRK